MSGSMRPVTTRDVYGRRWPRSVRRWRHSIIAEIDFTIPDKVIQLGLPPYRIDILTGVSGVSFSDAWHERVEDMFDDIRVPFMGRAAFIKNKRASGRLKDLADLESIGEL